MAPQKLPRGLHTSSDIKTSVPNALSDIQHTSAASTLFQTIEWPTPAKIALGKRSLPTTAKIAKGQRFMTSQKPKTCEDCPQTNVPWAPPKKATQQRRLPSDSISWAHKIPKTAKIALRQRSMSQKRQNNHHDCPRKTVMSPSDPKRHTQRPCPLTLISLPLWRNSDH